MASKRTPESYVFLERLGQGSYSTVFRAVERANGLRNYAIKVCSKKHIIRERKVKYVTIEKDLLNLLARGGHPGVVRLFCTFHDTDNLYYVLEFVSGGELLGLVRRMGRLPEEWCRRIASQLVDTVDYMHAKGVIHRDLKPENVLLSQEGRIVITDFGAACCASEVGSAPGAVDRAASFVGTAEYVSPELLLHSQCSFGSDVWALGCIIYQLTQGAPPFRGETELQTFEKIVALDYKWVYAAPPLIVALVQSILVLDPLQRPSAKQLKKNPWFAPVNWDDRATLWKGIWEVPNKAKSGSAHLPNSLPASDTPAGGIRVTRRKPIQAKSTDAIVEWRKKLGLGLDALPSPPASAGGDMSKFGGSAPRTVSPARGASPAPSVSPPTAPSARATSSSSRTTQSAPRVTQSAPRVTQSAPRVTQSAPRTTQSAPRTSLPAPHSAPSTPAPRTPPVGTQPIFVKRDIVSILEIPYDPSQRSISLAGYSKVEDSGITAFVTENKASILEHSANHIVALDVKGLLTCQGPNQPIRSMVSVSDPDLSMYDFEFDEANSKGFLILERFKSRLWFLSAASSEQALPVKLRSINKDKPWVDCFFAARKMVAEAENSKPKPVRPTSAPRPTSASKARPKQKPNASPRMVVSSSRYEVLHTLSGSGAKGGDATSGASAAFKSLTKK
ncbi:LAQU0S11e03862g1_1 [Lachancea quebecensis]|uniref:non-specific serine/threonine protein kinase n=1 Tax=Lachancea quebecensis TaxID=1654605 RepID=A0A0P1KUP6_9SACH|nr:LAQU0S11e03862g1_1 [Lachancea quebecensis]